MKLGSSKTDCLAGAPDKPVRRVRALDRYTAMIGIFSRQLPRSGRTAPAALLKPAPVGAPYPPLGALMARGYP
jgi:hypothetical protein